MAYPPVLRWHRAFLNRAAETARLPGSPITILGLNAPPNGKGNAIIKTMIAPTTASGFTIGPEDSFRDHSLFLKNRKNYINLFYLDITDYKGWANGLKKAGYATNPNYPSILIGIIQKYNLDQYDTPGGAESQNNKMPDTLLTKKDPDSIISPKDTSIQNTSAGKTYTVKQGDTLYNISKRFGLAIDDLKTLNNLADTNIKIGQKLVVAK